MNDTPAPALPSASILLLRDAPGGLEVFMVVRHAKIEFAAGASVFPGGRVTASDRGADLRPRCDGEAALDGQALAFRAAAIRECFEECGVLLARTQDGAMIAGGALEGALDGARPALEREELSLAELLAAHGLRLAGDALVPFGHWITPAFAPKRFETWFYLVAAPPGIEPRHDGSEAVDSLWISPEQALAEADAGGRSLVLATRANLMRLAESENVAAALDAAGRRAIVAVQPWMEERPEGKIICFGSEAGYALTELPAEVARGGPWPEAS
ncbi:MAG: NUDIX hydrolase [Alphaproteobacteria bacterium]